jgi:MraZ protein
MFRGRFIHSMDSKGRLSIPMSFRTELARRGDRAPILTNLQDCLALFAFEDWVDLERRLFSASPMHIEVQALQRFMVSGATESPIDAQGRLLVPPHLREFAGLEREVTIAGVGRWVELWDRTRFDQEVSKTRIRYPEISTEVAKLGA